MLAQKNMQNFQRIHKKTDNKHKQSNFDKQSKISSKNNHENIYYQNINSSCANAHKKSSTLKKFQHWISSNTTTIKIPKQNHSIFFNELTSTHNKPHPPKKPTQKPIYNAQKNIISHFVNQYQKIITNLTHYYQYYEWLLVKQIQKHDNYFNEIIRTLEAERKKTRYYLHQQIKALQQRIQLQKAALQNKISLLESNHLKPFEKQKIELQSQKLLQIPLFEVNVKGLDKIKTQIQNYIFQITNTDEIQNSKESNEQIEQSLFLQESFKKQTEEKKEAETCQQINDMTAIHPIEQNVKSNQMQVEDLYCDQDIQNILKAGKPKKKKIYQCQQDPIPQESQSHEDSLNISNLQPFS